MTDGYAQRIARLEALLEPLPDLIVAFSGGVDSSVLLHAAHGMLGPRCVGLIGDSPALPRRELAGALACASSIGARVETLATEELASAGYRANAGERCYFCRHTLFSAMARWAAARGFSTLAYGEIQDDLLDHRPGRRAAAELCVCAPLSEAGLDKRDVRRYAREHGLPVAEKSAAACLASRIPSGTEVTRERLARIERAEECLADLGFRTLRVRDHGPRARVEVDPDELARAGAARSLLAGRLASLGFLELELAPYRRPGAQEMRSPPANSASA
jgi:uncharacterized protein